MSETLFESPTYVYLSLVFAELVLAAIWYERRSRNWAKALLIPVALAATVVTVERLVVTEREKIVAVTEDIVEAVNSRQLRRIGGHLDEGFALRSPWMSADKAGLVESTDRALRTYAVRKVKLRKLDVEVTGDTARMRANTFVYFGRESARPIALIWDVVWVKAPAGWKVSVSSLWYI